MYVRSNAEIADAAIVAISLAGVFLQSIPNINILRILRCDTDIPLQFQYTCDTLEGKPHCLFEPDRGSAG